MGKVFHIYASQSRSNYAELDLPASDYEILDLMERLRLEPGQLPYLELLECSDEYDYLRECIHELPDLYQLNALARKLAEFTSVQDMASFEGLVAKELEKGSVPVELPKLIDFAYSTDCCYVAVDAVTDFQLGKFLAENGFIEDANGLPESALALLDYGKIGREHREQEGGVYTGFGYVEQHSELVNAYKTLDLTPKTPDYAILLKVSKGFFNDSVYDSDKTVQLKLPATPEALDAALTALDVWDWREAGWSCQDCRVPSLMDAVSDTDDIHAVNQLAQCLSEMDAGMTSKYKALLAAEDCSDLSRIVFLAGTLDAYIFEPQIRSLEDAARGKLSTIVSSQDAKTLLPYIDLTGYGRALLERDYARITEYGLLERNESQQIQDMEQDTAPGGMVIM